jgi:hypothetical protein
MAKRLLKQKAIELRLLGRSYSEIKKEIKVSKSSLSLWLKDMPLSPEAINDLKKKNRSVERFRGTMALKKVVRLKKVFGKVAGDIGMLTPREVFQSGLFLYWGEGWKRSEYTTGFTNTNPQMIKFFLRWLSALGIKKEKILIRLHLYVDMDIEKSIDYWVNEIGVARCQFRNSYIKNSSQSNITYKTGFGKGTCNVIVENRDLAEYVKMALKYIQTI